MPRSPDTHKNIERAALALFVSQGIDATTTRQIAQDAGISEGAIYRHFKSKDELAYNLFEGVHLRLADFLEKASNEARTIPEKARAIVTAYCTIADEDWLLFSYHLRFHHQFLAKFGKRKENPVSIVEQVIADGMASGDIPKGDPHLLTAMVLGLVFQTAAHISYGRVEGKLSDYIDPFTDAVLHILRV